MSNILEDLFSLKGKTALVTGGAKGLGAMISAALSRAGCKVIIVSSSKMPTGAAVHGVPGESFTFLKHDLSQMSGINAAVAEVKRLTPKLDILINNAGAFSASDIPSVDSDKWDTQMALNVRAPFFLVKELLPLLKAASRNNDPARVVNIGSIAALWPKSNGAYAYGASKAALHQLTRTLASDLTATGINVSAIAPGFFPTDMTGGLFAANPGSKEATIGMIPAGRLGEPQDVGGLAIFLCSRAGAYVSGAVIPLEGGLWSA